MRRNRQEGQDERTTSFVAIYEQNYPTVRGYLLRRMPRTEIADDLTAEVFESALRGLATFDSARGSHRQWLLGIARRRLARFWEAAARSHQAHRRVAVESRTKADPEAELFDRVEHRADLPRLVAALERLPPAYRAAIEERFLTGSSGDLVCYAELAGALCCSEAAARVRVHRALLALRAQMGRRPVP